MKGKKSVSILFSYGVLLNPTYYWHLQIYNLSCNKPLIREGGWNKEFLLQQISKCSHLCVYFQLQVLLLQFILFPLYLLWITVIPMLFAWSSYCYHVSCMWKFRGSSCEWSGEEWAMGIRRTHSFHIWLAFSLW